MRFLGHFLGGPYNNERMPVYADDLSAVEDRPAAWQLFRRVLTNRSGVPVGRVGVFRYKLRSTLAQDGDVWRYVYVDYVEEYGFA